MKISKSDINIILGLPLSMRGPSYTCARLAEAMKGPATDVTIHAPLSIRTVDVNVKVESFRITDRTRILHAVQLALGDMFRQRNENRVLRLLERNADRPIVYTFGEVSLETSRRLRAMGAFVVREKFNIGKLRGREIIDAAYAPFGVRPLFDIADAEIDKEYEEMMLADAIFSPSPMVAQSLAGIGVPEGRIIATSYGWEPTRFNIAPRSERNDKPTFLFVGFICVAKGAHILLEAWERAKLDGRLVLVGRIEPVIRDRFGHILARDDVEVVPFTPDPGKCYREADWFVFPSLAEGGPQVTYEAGAHGLPGLVSPMGAGAFLRHGKEGHIVDSTDPGQWAEALTLAAASRQDAKCLSIAARERARLFTWETVGIQRREALLKAADA